ncbi:MAG TPA: AAA family ATPase [Streptosporangiaceae bacterium]|nr:AAA family ATPase [Streptosporangiaceae bacterium]
MLRTLAIENYRSLRQLVLPLTSLNVVTGANGSGKSSLYRSLRLLADGARNGMVAALAREGGLPSTLWAGPEVIGRAVREGRYPVQGTASRRQSVALKLGFGEDDFGYAIDLGLPQERKTVFARDPVIKRECIWGGPVLRPSTVLCDRVGGFVRVRSDDGDWSAPFPIREYDSMLGEFADPQRAPELVSLRDRIRSWRFYDHFRTDAAAPARGSQIGTRTPVLGHDGSDLAAALQTIREIGDAAAVDAAVDAAFPGSALTIDGDDDGRLSVRLHQHGLLRALEVAELSDGTLRYLLWIAALLSPRPASLLVLNEPETSLHPDLLAPLGRLISQAAARTQVIAVSHAAPLIEAVAADAGAGTDLTAIELIKEFGETRVRGLERFDGPSWVWPKR